MTIWRPPKTAPLGVAGAPGASLCHFASGARHAEPILLRTEIYMNLYCLITVVNKIIVLPSNNCISFLEHSQRNFAGQIITGQAVSQNLCTVTNGTICTFFFFFFCAALTDYRHLEVATLHTGSVLLQSTWLHIAPSPGPPDDNAFSCISRIRGCPSAD